VAATDGLKLPIPEITDTADGPDAISDLANAVEDYVLDRLMPTGIVHYGPHHWGTGTVYPTTAAGVRPFDTYYHSGLVCLMRYDGTTWTQAARSVVTTPAARAAISTNYAGLLHDGFTVWDSTSKLEWRWNVATTLWLPHPGTEVFWASGFSSAQGWADSPVGAWNTPRVGGSYFAGGVYTNPFPGEFDLRCRLYPGSGAQDQGVFVARFQVAAAGTSNWVNTAAHSGRFFGNESSILLDYTGRLDLNAQVRVVVWSNASALPGLTSAPGLPFLSVTFKHPTPVSVP
jgi:hypothetical protein